MSIRREVAFVSCFVSLSVAACGNLLDKMKGDAGAAVDAGAVAESGSGIANEAAITRYAADEQPAGGEVQTLRASVVHATYPGTDIVATLPAESSVLQLATHAGGVLVVFDSVGTKKMGWIDVSAVPAIAATLEDASVAKAATAVVVRNTDAGAAKAVDAGAPKVVDAGAPKVVVDAGAPKVVVDAGAPKPSTTKQVVKPMPASGKCESGYYQYPAGEKTCRLVCTSDSECGGAKCRAMSGAKICYR